MKCKTAEELMALAKENSYELTKEQAEAFLAEGGPVVNLSEEDMEKVAGGDCWARVVKTG